MVKRDKSPATTSGTARAGAPIPDTAKISSHAKAKGRAAAKNAAAKATAKAARAKTLAPLKKAKVVNVQAPKAVREEPHIRKSDDGKPLVERLNPKLLAQLRERKVTNAAAAEALGVHETYLCRVLKELGEEKVKGATTEHREARNKLVTARRQTREMLAKKVNKGDMTITAAAKAANCSERTMFRYCAQYAK